MKRIYAGVCVLCGRLRHWNFKIREMLFSS